MVFNKFLAIMLGIGNNTAAIMWLHLLELFTIYKKKVSTSFWRHCMGLKIEVLMINILMKERYTNLDIFLENTKNHKNS